MKLRTKPGRGPYDLDYFYYLDVVAVVAAYVVLFGGMIAVAFITK